ncbi:MAG TPA: amidohydrolase, partial [Bacteroidales bacterium]|nr:amidohydrolase [Bacteroidales bacterium]
MQDLRISLIQDELVWEDPAANRARFQAILESMEDTDLVLLPEMFSTGFTVHPQRVAESMDGTTIQWLRRMARESGKAMAGSLIVKEGESYYNRLVFCHPDGALEHYDKRHLFRMGGEHLRFGMGNHNIMVNYRGWKIRPLICYDLRFPVWARNRYSEGNYDYDLLLYLANWPRARRHHWMTLLSARAIENQCYVAGLNRVGTDGAGVSYSGDSRVIGPGGEEITVAGEEAPCVLR